MQQARHPENDEKKEGEGLSKCPGSANDERRPNRYAGFQQNGKRRGFRRKDGNRLAMRKVLEAIVAIWRGVASERTYRCQGAGFSIPESDVVFRVSRPLLTGRICAHASRQEQLR